MNQPWLKARLDELDKEEFRLVARKLAPHLTDEDFDQQWADFQQMKAERQRTKSLN